MDSERPNVRVREDESPGENYLVEIEYSDEHVEQIEKEIERQLIDRGVDTRGVDIAGTLGVGDTVECHHFKNCLVVCTKY
ncbi:hypothetical protein [Natrinema salaciae]|uniref:hypothetical protein n=1 Tax=Natrinema salaciae TaxID=1186196 RepID=UPI001113C853|nr:hypothetical protein [Natrinema salaciae]